MFWSVTLWSVTAEKRRRLKQTGFGHVNCAFMRPPPHDRMPTDQFSRYALPLTKNCLASSTKIRQRIA